MLKIQNMLIVVWYAFSYDTVFAMKDTAQENQTSKSRVQYDEQATEDLEKLVRNIAYHHMFRNIKEIKTDHAILQNDIVINKIKSLLKKGANPNIYGVPRTKTILQAMLTILAKNNLPQEEINRVNAIVRLFISYGAETSMNFKVYEKKQLKCLLKLLQSMVPRLTE